MAQLSGVDGIGHPQAVRPANVIAGNDRTRPTEPKKVRPIEDFWLADALEENL